MPNDRKVSMLENQIAERQAGRPRQENEPRDSGDCPNRSAQLRAYADSDADNIWPRHQLAEGQGFSEFLLAHPPLLFDDHTARPHRSATEAAQRDLEKA